MGGRNHIIRIFAASRRRLGPVYNNKSPLTGAFCTGREGGMTRAVRSPLRGRHRCAMALSRTCGARLEPEASHQNRPSRKYQMAPQGPFDIWRRERDSNPRWAFNPYSLSRGAPSATRPSLQKTLFFNTALYQAILGITRGYRPSPFGPPSPCDDVQRTASRHFCPPLGHLSVGMNSP